mgnify:CR=1 FL=1
MHRQPAPTGRAGGGGRVGLGARHGVEWEGFFAHPERLSRQQVMGPFRVAARLAVVIQEQAGSSGCSTRPDHNHCGDGERPGTTRRSRMGSPPPAVSAAECRSTRSCGTPNASPSLDQNGPLQLPPHLRRAVCGDRLHR